MNREPESPSSRLPGSASESGPPPGQPTLLRLSAAVRREQPEPYEGQQLTPLWLVTLIGVVLFWSGVYVQRYGGGFQALEFDERAFGVVAVTNEPADLVDLVALGKRTYLNTCQACHQQAGQGIPGQYPPLAGSEWLLAGGHARLIRIVLDGLQGPVEVKGQVYNSIMVPWRDALRDEQIAAVLSHERQEWGNNRPPVPVEDVTAIREKTKARAGQPWTAEELLKIPETE